MMTETEAQKRILSTKESYENNLMVSAETIIFCRWLMDNNICADFIEWTAQRNLDEPLLDSFSDYRDYWYKKQLQVSE